jgi:hypothetical protein
MEKHPVQSRLVTISDRPSEAVAQQQTRPELAAFPSIPERWDDEDGDALATEAQSSSSEQITHLVQDTGFERRSRFDGEHRPRALGKASNHSRLRKDLVNLNKGVAKWLAKEGEGLLTRDDVFQRIRSSAAARHLAETHEGAYQEMEFIQNAITRAELAASRSIRQLSGD